MLACWLASAPLAAATPADEPLIIVEDDPGAGDSNDAPVLIDDSPAAASISLLPSPRLNFALTSRLLLNAHVNDSSVEVFQMWHLGSVRLEQNVTAQLGATAEVAARWGVLGKDPSSGPLLLFNIQNPQWVGEVLLREAYGRWRWGPWSVNLGARRYVWGKNEVLSPADVLNPLDLRYDPTLVFVLPTMARAPIFAADVAYAFDDTTQVQLVVAPFFATHNLFYWGHDTAILANTTVAPILQRFSGGLEANARDRLEGGIVGTELPSYGPQGSSLAVRATWRLADWDMAATGYWGWDRTPWLTVDTGLITGLAAAAVVSGATPQSLLGPLEQAVLSGTQLVTATYVRTGTVALEGEGPVGPLLLRADVGLGINQVFYTTQLTPLQLHSLRGILSAEYLQGDQWFASIGVYANSVFNPPGDALLLGVEAPDTSFDRSVALTWGWVGSVRWHWQEPSIEIRGNAAYDIKLGDYVAWMQLAYSPWDTHTFALGATLVGGASGTVGSQFSQNDLLFCQYQTAW